MVANGSCLAAISGRLSSSKSLRTMILSSVCTHRRHLKLDAMRTLILADNGLERIQLSTDDDGGSIAEEDESEESVRLVAFGWSTFTN